ncbi:MAG: site-specific integrase [Acidimicrobiales bacterium]
MDFEAGTIGVDRALVRGPGSQLTRAEPKTAKSRRVITMPTPVLDALLGHRDQQKVRAIKGDDFVFATASGTPIDPSNARRAFARMTEAAGIGRWSPVELRHSAASLLSAAGVPIDQVTDLLGHVDSRMLDRHYRHATTTSYVAAVAPMEDLFATGGKPTKARRAKR